MTLRGHKTRIVATIGPSSSSPPVLERMMEAGMDVARLNFSHGDFEEHRETLGAIRAASERTGKRVAVMADLPGPKLRIGMLAEEPVMLAPGDSFTLSTAEEPAGPGRVSVNFSGLPAAVKKGDGLFLNDGLIELEVETVEGGDVGCRVRTGGELRSRKGINLPGIDLGIGAFTDHDRECLEFALQEGVDAVSQSFVETAADVAALRESAAGFGHSPFVVAKIERASAVERLDEILEEADGIMVARGDLGVEVPVERMAVLQKEIVHRAVVRGKPVITATHMLESMTESRRPTRAEATDVANAILDGTDCVMLSGESASGKYPVEAVAMLAKIAAATEPNRPGWRRQEVLEAFGGRGGLSSADLVAVSVANALKSVTPAAVIVPTVSGATARNIARFRLPVWIAAVSPREETCRQLQFSYGVQPVCQPEYRGEWNGFAREWIGEQGLKGEVAILTEGPSQENRDANHRMELLDLR